jgi:diphthine synthase
LKELVFVGLGLHNEKGISLQGLEETKTADCAFMELYTSILPCFSTERFEEIANKKVHIVSRRGLEEESGALILDAAEKGKTVFLIPGDPFIATTHVALRIEAERRGVKTRIVHGASVMSAKLQVWKNSYYTFPRERFRNALQSHSPKYEAGVAHPLLTRHQSRGKTLFEHQRSSGVAFGY